ncbi:MAG TPA: hypothetical protein VIL18_02325, partial [Longimicrobiales bacterium]
FAAGRPAAAQVPPHEDWRTFRTEHFRITFSPGLEALARHAAERAEAAYERLAQELADPPRGTIDVLLTDGVDFANGFATPFPSNRITIYATPPLDDLGLAYTRDWVELVIVHELVHIVHLDDTGILGSILRTVFGRVPFGWPYFPAIATPQWSIEGLATYFESRLTGAGRTRGSLHEMVLRTAVLEGRFESIDQATGLGPVWPGSLRSYVYGSLFLDHLTREHGPEVLRAIVGRTARALVPPTLAFDRIGRKATGENFTDAWDAWRRELEERYGHLAEEIRSSGITQVESLTPGGYYLLHPRAGPDGRVAFSAVDGRSASATRILDPATGEIRTLARRNGTGPSAWLPDGSLLLAQFEVEGQYRLFQDLYRVDGDGREHRLTRGARLAEPDVAPDGRRVVAVQRGGGRTRLVTYDLETGNLRPLAGGDAEEWSLPRWAPDGTRIAAARWRPGGEHDIVVLDTLGRVLQELTRDRAIDGAPAWSPDGRYVLFWSDRSGIPNLYAYDLAAQVAAEGEGAARLRQVTNVLTGAFYPDVSPDGRWIYFTGYHADGFHIERIPFDPSAWREPAPLAPMHEEPPASAPLAPPSPGGGQQGGEARPYSAWPTLLPRTWMPILIDEGEPGLFVGVTTFGQDLVGRHEYSLEAAVSVDGSERRLTGAASYRWAGLGNPVLGIDASRRWDLAGYVVLQDSSLREVHSREDVIAVSATLARQRWRSASSLTLGAEHVDERFLVQDAPGVRLTDDRDRLFGVFAGVAFNNARFYPFSISREDGVTLSIGARRRWDTNPSSAIDRSYDEATAWIAGYKAARVFGFANHVFAVRASGVVRDGPAAPLVDVGGASGSTVSTGIGSIGSEGLFLPVRGFPEGVRAGTRAWSASIEYRLPIALIGRGAGLRPFYLDRLSASLFADAGDAWCTAEEEARNRLCAAGAGTSAPLVSAGAELGLDITLFFGTPSRLRAGVAFPLKGPRDTPAYYLRVGHSF